MHTARAQRHTWLQRAHYNLFYFRLSLRTDSFARLLSAPRRVLCDGRSNTALVETANLVEAIVRRLSHSSNHGEGCVVVGYCVERSVSGEAGIDFAADGSCDRFGALCSPADSLQVNAQGAPASSPSSAEDIVMKDLIVLCPINATMEVQSLSIQSMEPTDTSTQTNTEYASYLYTSVNALSGLATCTSTESPIAAGILAG